MAISQPISGIERRFQWETLCFDPMYEVDMRSLSGFGLPWEVVVSTYHMYGTTRESSRNATLCATLSKRSLLNKGLFTSSALQHTTHSLI